MSKLQCNTKTRVQLNIFELNNLLHSYAYYLAQRNGPRENSLTVKLTNAVKRCENQLIDQS